MQVLERGESRTIVRYLETVERVSQELEESVLFMSKDGEKFLVMECLDF